MSYIINQMKQLRLIPQSWQPEDALQTTPPALLGTQTNVSPKKTPRVVPSELRETERRAPQPEKMRQLREYLRNIEDIPVHTVQASESTFFSPLAVLYDLILQL